MILTTSLYTGELPLYSPIAPAHHRTTRPEENRRTLLCGALLYKPEEISGYVEGDELVIALQNIAADKGLKCPKPPVLVRAKFAEWRDAFTLTPKLREKLLPVLARVAPSL
jgi:hypothetical protein